ncbi:MAG: cytochrome c [Proteobacteria bacterium]|nr:cytochrome c [Pseudomonadota bacterium]
MKQLLTLLFLSFVALASVQSAGAETRLRTIMNELNMNTMKVVDGVMREDFALIEAGATAIAEHEKAPMAERKRIVGHLKERASGFKGIDGALHNDAVTVAEAARARDLEAVVEGLARIQRGCVACHTGFRQEVRQLFYK